MLTKTLWQHAQELIPGGNNLASKRPNRYAPGLYPSHDIYCHGDKVIDAETNKEYTDLSTMGTGCCILGYGYPEVDSAAIQAIAQGSMGALNPVEELELAEVMLKLNPGMQKVRFARSGGEACMIAARICNTYKPATLFLQHGYSGWQLGNPEKSWTGLDFSTPDHLGLFEEVADDISFVIMEPVRNYPDSSIELMKETRKFCTKYGIPLVIDEITAGFRCGLSGYHLLKSIQPDIAVYGKSLGNGYCISAIVGKEEVMSAAERTFISSTMHSERIGYAASLATMEVMREKKVPEYLIRTGKYIQDGWTHLADIAGLEIEVTGIPPLAHFEFKTDNDKRMTYLTQELLKKNILGTDQFYASLAHTQETLDNYLFLIDQIFTDIADDKVKLDSTIRDKGWQRCN